jgi:hypothetical protein
VCILRYGRTGPPPYHMQRVAFHDFRQKGGHETAYVWQALARARIGLLGPGIESTIWRSVNLRRYFDIPATYPGYISMTLFSNFRCKKSWKVHLATLHRYCVRPSTTREVATLLYRAVDKSTFSKSARLNLDSDVIIRSALGLICGASSSPLDLVSDAQSRPGWTMNEQTSIY